MPQKVKSINNNNMEDGHFIDDPLVVASIKPDFSGLGLSKKVGDKEASDKLNEFIDGMR